MKKLKLFFRKLLRNYINERINKSTEQLTEETLINLGFVKTDNNHKLYYQPFIDVNKRIYIELTNDTYIVFYSKTLNKIIEHNNAEYFHWLYFILTK